MGYEGRKTRDRQVCVDHDKVPGIYIPRKFRSTHIAALRSAWQLKKKKKEAAKHTEATVRCAVEKLQKKNTQGEFTDFASKYSLS